MMLAGWWIAQGAHALVAWGASATVVVQYATRAGVGSELPGYLRAAVRTGASPRRALETVRAPPPFAVFAEIEDDPSVDTLTWAVSQARADCWPPTRLLRLLATAGTMLGLLATGAVLDHAASAGNLATAAGSALDRAVFGFGSALPCWTAIAVSERCAAALRSRLDAIALAWVGASPGVAEPGSITPVADEAVGE